MPDATARPGTMLVQLISEGWGTSGYYPATVLEQAARDRRFPTGLQMYCDHPTATEAADRPERSVRDLAAVLTEDARYDPDRRALVATAKPMPTYRDLLGDPDFTDAVGLSIRADGLAEYGTADGRQGPIVQQIGEAQSVDFVTKAGRGGKVLALLESARARTSWPLAEAATEQTRAALNRAIHAAHAPDGSKSYAWVRDFDPDLQLVWFDTSGEGDGGDSGTWQQGYDIDNATVTLLGERLPVVAETVYRPASENRDDADGDGDEDGEDLDGDGTATQITEAATTTTVGTPPHGTPTTGEEPAMSGNGTGAQPGQAGADTAVFEIKAQEAVQERDVALREAAEAKAELARFRAVESARPVAAAALAESGLPPAAQQRVTTAALANVPLTETGGLDEPAFKALVEAEATAEKTYLAQLAEAGGAGRVAGFGTTPTVAGTPSVAGGSFTPSTDPNATLVEAYKARGMTPEAARLAARGRAF